MAKKKKMLYFAYGMNMDPEGMERRCPDAKAVGTATLKGYALRFRGGLANVEPVEGREVQGVLWEVSEKDLKALDRFEGYPKLYQRDEFEVETPTAKVKAVMYYMNLYSQMSEPNHMTAAAMQNGHDTFGIDREQFDYAVKEARTLNKWLRARQKGSAVKGMEA